MAAVHRKGFTLVEMLVVIVIISALMALLLPAIQSARSKGKVAQCMNNQHEISLALLQYEGAKKHFPGYVNKIGTGALSKNDPRMPLSWATVILPHLDREDLWRGWRELRTNDAQYAAKFAQLQVRVPQLVCPSDPSTENAMISYAANCGLADDAQDPADSKNAGVFHNLYTTNSPEVSSSSIRDGAAQTILFSENIQSGLWYAEPNRSHNEWEADMGMNWVWVEYADLQNPVAKERPKDPAAYINGCWDGCDTYPNVSTRPVDYAFARPSSGHPGGVMASFCDGHQKFISERIDYITYQHLMTPDDQQTGLCRQIPDPEWQE